MIQQLYFNFNLREAIIKNRFYSDRIYSEIRY